MAVTSLAIRDPHFINGCNSWSSPQLNRQFYRSVQEKRFLKLQFGCSSFQTFSPATLRSVCTACPDQHVRWWQSGQTRVQVQSRRAGTRLQVVSIVTEKVLGGSQYSANSDQSVRRLILLRHAKSSWTDRSIKDYDHSKVLFLDPDHERPLSKRGRQAAANVALRLHQCSGWEPQLILCSDSTRTRETLDVMKQQMPEFLEGEVRYFSSFYSVAAMDGQTVQHLQDIICKYSKDDVKTIMCMGHNRGWEEAASFLSGANVELKTANAALLETQGSSWQEAFELAGVGGWKLVGIVKPDSIVEGAVQ